ncbi:MAG: TerC/Alx family metal homeostasis membrane protein [Acidobacteriaceae bacterium]
MPPAPIAYWIGFHLALLLLLAVELVYARRQSRLARDTHRTALAATALWITAALVFAVFLHHSFGPAASAQYLAGYAIEESLSIDNLFVFLLLFRLFQIDSVRQPRVLFWGVAGAILLRGLFIAGGLTLLTHFAWISYAFALLLLIAAVRLLLPNSQNQPVEAPGWIAWLTRLHPVSASQDHFIVRENGRPTVTLLLLALVAIELCDVVFALDSIPAVLSITRNAFLAYTSNIMAVMGLRSLYFLLIGALTRLRFLHYGLAAVLAFAALKMLTARWIEIGPLASLATVLTILAITLGASLWVPHSSR